MVHSALVSHRNELNSLAAHIVKGKEVSSLFARQKRDGASSAQTSEPIILVSGRRSEVLSFQRTLGPSLIRHGETPSNVSTTPLCENGCHIAQNMIPLLHL